MKLNLPKKITFWASVIIAVVGVVVYLVHVLNTAIPYLGAAGFLIVVAAFILMCLGLTVKGL
jgi:hypothetical protein